VLGLPHRPHCAKLCPRDPGATVARRRTHPL